MEIIPAILTETSDEAIAQITQVRDCVTCVQFDVMDGTMTESITCDLFDLAGEAGTVANEVHLMVEDPAMYLAACAAMDAQRVYFHPEPVESVSDVLAQMSEYDFARGISVSPQTDIEQIAPYLDEIDAVQIMTVTPGAQGQQFMPEMLEKVRAIKKQHPSIWVAVDGGVSAETIMQVSAAGADAVGVGGAIFEADNPTHAVRHLQEILRQNS
jgi:ribulose-phosphate 3-epimerase